MASEYFYGGRTYSMDPHPKDDGFVGYRTNFSSLSLATDQRTANQIKDVSENLNSGVKNIEVGSVAPDVFESIPKEHFKEMNRLAKLTGADLTFHAPMIDPTGITDHGWDAMTQKSAENQLWNAIEKANGLNPKGTVVTFHATSIGLPSAEMKVKEDGKEKIKSLLAVDQTGKLIQIKEEDKYYGSEDNKPIKFDAMKELDRINDDQWRATLSNLNFQAHRGEEVLDHSIKNFEQLQEGINTRRIANDQLGEELTQKEKDAFDFQKKEIERDTNHGKIYLREAYRDLRELYNRVYPTVDDETKKKLREYYNKVEPYIKDYNTLDVEKVKDFAKVIEDGVKVMDDIKDIKIFKPLREFAIEKSAETTANLAWKGYEKFGDNAPIMAVENHPAQMSLLTTGDDLRAVIEKAQDNFVKKAKEEGMSESQARNQAKKLIGATWDVGHINMLRKQGYGSTDIIDQTKAVAPYVKKVHLSDNFGFEHTELPMGMGNVPIREIMEKLGKQEGFGDVKKIIEAGNWWQHFSPGGKNNSPLVPTMRAFGSTIPGVGGEAGGVGWNQVYGTPAGYFSGYGTMLPEQNFSIYGAGFTSLPTELGGQISGKDSRFSGTPMS